MKRILTLISALAVIGLFVIPSGVAFADQTYHTERLPLYLTDEGAAAGYPLRNGMVVNIHANGPNNAAIEHYMLNGAKPNTTYEICRVWAENLYLDFTGDGVADAWLPAHTPIDAGAFIHTDKNGNGNCTIKLTPEYLAPIVTRSFTVKFVFIVGGNPVEVIPGTGLYKIDGGTPAYETIPTSAQLD
jgi:hypothetical protein